MRIVLVAVLSLFLAACCVSGEGDDWFVHETPEAVTFIGPKGSAFNYKADAVPGVPEGQTLPPEARFRVRIPRANLTE